MDSRTNITNSRDLNVFRNREHEPLVTRLCSDEQKSIFRYKKDLMVFAAMVGRSFNFKESLTKNPIQIALGTYSNDEKDAFIYLLALMDLKNSSCLKDENLPGTIKIFEEYCNGGLNIVQEWLDENSRDPDGISTLMRKIYEKVCENEDVALIDNEALNPEF